MTPVDLKNSKLVDEKLFILYDNFHGKERLVTERQISDAFSKERIVMIKAGNDDYWNLIEYN